jgi:acetyl-CoA carboxylase carboxyltransferase component
MSVTKGAAQSARDKHLELIVELEAEMGRVRAGGGAKAVERHRGRGKMTARERIGGVC